MTCELDALAGARGALEPLLLVPLPKALKDADACPKRLHTTALPLLLSALEAEGDKRIVGSSFASGGLVEGLQFFGGDDARSGGECPAPDLWFRLPRRAPVGGRWPGRGL